MKRSAFIVTATFLLGAAAWVPQSHGRDGRWVLLGLPISYVFRGDSVEMLTYPPQAPAMMYRVRGDSVETQAQGQRSVSSFSIRHDTLVIRQASRVVRYVRFGARSGAERALTGTWRTVDSGPRSVVTFRSDGQLMPEVGAPMQVRLRGDTMEVSSGTQSLRTVLVRTGDTITISPPAGDKAPVGAKPQTIVRRAWGCFGIPALDRSAKECR